MCGYLVFRHSTAAPAAVQSTVQAQPPALPLLVSLPWHSLAHTSDTTSLALFDLCVIDVGAIGKGHLKT